MLGQNCAGREIARKRRGRGLNQCKRSALGVVPRVNEVGRQGKANGVEEFNKFPEIARNVEEEKHYSRKSGGPGFWDFLKKACLGAGKCSGDDLQAGGSVGPWGTIMSKGGNRKEWEKKGQDKGFVADISEQRGECKAKDK